MPPPSRELGISCWLNERTSPEAVLGGADREQPPLGDISNAR